MALTEGIRSRSVAVPRSLVLNTTGLLVCVVFLLVFRASVFGITDPDFWWHLRTGQYIFETQSIPKLDVFSYTFQGQPRIPQEWASEVLIFLAFRSFGYVGDVLLFASIVTVTFFLIYRLCRKLGVSSLTAGLSVFWGAMLARAFFTVRPQVLTWLFFAVFLMSLYLYHRGKLQRLWHLPLLMVLWVNFHGGFAIGLGLVGLLVLARVLDAVLLKQPLAIQHLLVVLGLCLLATLISPDGLAGLSYPLTYIGFDNPSARFITEWQSPDFHQYYWLLLLVSLLLFMALGLANRRLGAWPALLVTVLAAMTLQSSRHVPLYGMAMAPVLGEMLETRFNLQRVVRRQSPTRAWALVNWALLVLISLGVVASAVASPDAQLQDIPLQFHGYPYPVAGAQYIRANYPNARMFNEYDWGGYLIYALYPTQRVFVDGRADLYSSKFLDDYADVTFVKPDWEEVLDRYGVDLVLVKKDSPLSLMLAATPPWRKAFTGDIEDIFVRKDAPG